MTGFNELTITVKVGAGIVNFPCRIEDMRSFRIELYIPSLRLQFEGETIAEVLDKAINHLNIICFKHK